MEFNFSKANEIAQSNARIQKELAYQQAVAVKTEMLKEQLPLVAAGLKKLGLEISSMDFRISDESFQLSGNITAIQTNAKFRFVEFAGYTASGAGRNQAKLQAKATQIDEAVKVGPIAFSTNMFSLEVGRRDSGTTPRVLISFYLE